MKHYAFFIIVSLVICCITDVKSDDIVMKNGADIQILEYGDYGNASGWLHELLEKYLLRALKKKNLSGSGKKITFVLEAKAPSWEDIPKKQIKDIGDIDAFEITP